MLLLSSEDSSPPGRPCALLSVWSSGPRLCPIRGLLDHLRRFSLLSESVELLVEIVTSTLGLFPDSFAATLRGNVRVSGLSAVASRQLTLTLPRIPESLEAV